MSRNRREFSVGEVVHVLEHGRGVVREVIGYEGHGTDYVRIVFEGDKANYACWLFTADRVIKEDAMDDFMDDAKYELAHRYRERFYAAEPPEFLPRFEWPEDTPNDNFCSGEVVDIPIAYARGVVKGFPGLHYLEVVIDGYNEPQIISAKHVKKLGGSDGRVED